MLEKPLFFPGCSGFQSLIHLSDLQDIMLCHCPPLSILQNLCDLWDAIGHNVLLIQALPRETQDFPKGWQVS